MLINKISVNYNNSNINYKGKNIIQKEAAIYKSSLELASKDVIEYFGNQTKKVQNSYNTFLNNWVNEQNKALKTLLTLPVLVAYFSKDKSNKLEVDSENHSASLQTQDSKNIFYKNGTWSEEIPNLENSLIQIINNNVENIDDKAKLLYSLSGTCLNKLLLEKDSSYTDVIKNLHNLFECIAKMYDIRKIEEKLYDFFDSNLASKTSNQIKENGWKTFYNEGTYYTLDTDKEFYEALFCYSINHFRATKYKRKIEPKLSVEMIQGADIIKTYDSEGNCYEREIDYLFGNHYISTKAKIKGFGEVICYTTPGSDIYRYDIIPESEESPQRYKLNGKTGEVTKK